MTHTFSPQPSTELPQLPEAWRIADAPDSLFEFKYYSPDDILLEQGQNTEGLYVIVSGAVALIRADNRGHSLLAYLAHGTCFGTETLTNFESSPYSAIAQDEPTIIAFLPMQLAAEWYESSSKPRELIEHLGHALTTEGEHVVSVEPSLSDPVNAIRMIFDRPGGYRIESSLTFGWFLIEVDRTDLEAISTEELTFENPKLNKGRILRLQGNTLIGVTVQGGWPDLGKLHDLMIRQHQLSFRQRALFRTSGEIYLPSADDPRSDLAIICRCTGVTKGELRTAVANGASSPSELARITGASRVCGSCGPQLTNLATGQSHWIGASRIEKHPLNQDIASFRIFLPHSIKTYQPGQNVSLEAWINNQWMQRTYTLTSLCSCKEYIEITVKRESQGLFSRWLHDRMQATSTLRVMNPEGHFVPPNNSRPLVFFAGGIGVTPGLSIFRNHAEHHQQAKSDTPLRELYLDYSVRNRNEAILIDEFTKISNDFPGIDFNLRLCEKDGYIDKSDIDKIIQRYTDAEFMICGPEPYMRSIKSLLRKAKISNDKIQIEHFIPVEIRRAGMRLTHPALALLSSLLILIGILSYTLLPQRLAATDFSDTWSLEQLWSDNFWKQVSGYHLLVIGVIMAAISARKRWRSLSKVAEFGAWRNLHFILGILLLVALGLHTGFSLGENISRYLTISLLAVMATGAITGLSGYREWRKPNTETENSRRKINLIHLITIAFLPILLTAHVISIYYF